MIVVSFAGTTYNIPEPGDAFTQSLTDFLASLSTNSAVALLTRFTPATLPAPSATWSRRFVSVMPTGGPEQIQYCRETTPGVFEWIVVAF